LLKAAPYIVTFVIDEMQRGLVIAEGYVIRIIDRPVKFYMYRQFKVPR